MQSLSISNTLSSISTDKSLVLFNTIALSSENTNLTRNQYYTRLSCLVKAGLIIRKNGKYFLSSLGKIVYEAQMLIGKGIENFWKLKAIDSIELSPDSPRLPAEEHKRIIDTLVDRNDIKDILLDHNNKILVTQKEKVYNSQELITLNPRVCDSIHHFSRMHALKGYLKQLG